jgi:hypothetical protein
VQRYGGAALKRQLVTTFCGAGSEKKLSQPLAVSITALIPSFEKEVEKETQTVFLSIPF